MRSNTVEQARRAAGAWIVAALALVPGVLVACSDRDEALGAIPTLPPRADVDGGDLEGDAAVLPGGLALGRIDPNHGSFVGGGTALVRGVGFRGAPEAEVSVEIGGRAVQPANTMVIDDRRISVVVPAGEPGTVDVVVAVGDGRAVLEGGYTYDALDVRPARGSVAGGTVLRILGSGTAFVEGATVSVGPAPCKSVVVVSPTEITCRTGASLPDEVDVTVTLPDAADVVGVGAFEYYDGTDPVYGGLGGGPILGTVNVTVLDAFFGLPVPDAFVLVGEDLGAPYQGETDVRGQVTFSGDDLLGPINVHVAKHCFEKASFVSFDATDVTVFLVPWTDPDCLPPPNPGGGGGRPVNGAFVEGKLTWPFKADAFGLPWALVPTPRAGERRMAYVFATQDSVDFANPPPGGGSIVLDPGPAASPEAYGYSIFVRPAAMAVVALAGIESDLTGEFRPYVMGITRNVFPGPGDIVTGVDIAMDIPLDRVPTVTLAGTPGGAVLGPDRFRGRLHLDLGGEGVVVRTVEGRSYDEVVQSAGTKPFRFTYQPALKTPIKETTYRLELIWSTGALEREPLTAAVLTGVRFDSGPVQVEGLVGIPLPVSPPRGSVLPPDRVLRWSDTGGLTPDFHVVLMVGGDGNPAWSHVVPGDVHEAPIPDFSVVPGLADVSPGFVTWVVYAVKAPGFAFNEFSYRYFESAYWSHYAFDAFAASQD